MARGSYPYTEHLKVLDARRPKRGSMVPERLQQVCTPLVWKEWQHCLASHPDKEYSNYLLKEGFRVGYQYEGHSCVAAKANKSAAENPEVVDS